MGRRQINAEELNALFTLIGKGIWHLQYLEDALHTYLTIKRDIKIRGSMPAEQADSILAKHRTRTLGASLRLAREAQVLSPSLQGRLDHFKEERDWLVHRCLHQHHQDLHVNDKRYELLRRIELFSKEAMAIHKLIAKEVEDYVVAQDVSRKLIYRNAEENITKLKGKKPKQ
jgi:hypothetical protein